MVLRGKLRHGGARVATCAVAPSGEIVLSGNDGVVSVWSPSSLELLAELDKGVGGYCNELLVTRSGHVVAALGSEARVFSLASRERIGKYSGHSGMINCAVELPTAGLVATGADDKEVHVWRVQECKAVHKLSLDYAFIMALAVVDTLLVAGDYAGKLRYWHVAEDFRPGPSWSSGKCIYGMSGLPRRRIATGHEDNSVRVWDLTTSPPVRLAMLRGHTGYVFGLLPLPDGALCTASNDFTIRVWDVDAGSSEVVATAPDQLWRLATTAGGDVVATCEDGHAYVYRVDGWLRRRAAVFAWVVEWAE